jgi:hypothetical protein
MRVIAVDPDLSNVRRTLADAGYQVTGVRPEDIGRADAVVVSGMEINFNGNQEIMTRAPVINARSLTAEQVLSEIRERLS